MIFDFFFEFFVIEAVFHVYLVVVFGMLLGELCADVDLKAFDLKGVVRCIAAQFCGRLFGAFSQQITVQNVNAADFEQVEASTLYAAF